MSDPPSPSTPSDLPPILERSGIRPAGDAARQAAWRTLAAHMVETDILPNGARTTILSREWIAARGWAVMLFFCLPDPEQDALLALLTSLGHTELLATAVGFTLGEAKPGPVWRLPNTPEDEGVPFNNYRIFEGGQLRVVFPEDGSFAFHTDEEGDVNILAGPADLVRAASGGDPAAANARYLARALAAEGHAGFNFQPGVLSNVARRYAPFLLQD